MKLSFSCCTLAHGTEEEIEHTRPDHPSLDWLAFPESSNTFHRAML